MEKGCGATDLVIQGCGQSFGIAFDGKARAIVILANMHRNELFGAIGDEPTRCAGGLVVREMAFCR